jgi:branched-chain amino acid transport system permease protein
MITLAIGEIAHTAARRLEPVTHGTDGFSGIPAVVPVPGMPALFLDGLVYYYVLAVFLLLYGLVAVVRRSSFGLALRGLRDNEARLRAIGYPSGVFGVAAYCFAGAIAGVAGSLWATAQQFVAPADMGFQVAALALLAVVIGGVGSMWGACLGAGLVVFTQDYIGGFLAGHGHLLLGVLFVLAVYLIPRGVAGLTWKRARA